MKPPVRPLKITRSRHRPENGGGTAFFKVDVGRLGRFLEPHQVPDFDGDEAWFEIEGFQNGPLRLIRQVDPPY